MDELIIAGRSFNSRLMVGTGKFSSNEAMVASMEGSGSEIVTVALRRVDVDNPQDSLLTHIDPKRYLLLPNTSGARDAEEAIRLARIARAAGCEPWIKLEVTPDPYYLLPDPIETLKAAEFWSKKALSSCPTSTQIRYSPSTCRRLAPRQ
jgi:thiazole synthase